ncbi:MAG TPA: YdbH family protein [Erwinia sp.]|uniref:YdbH family protein n=1 Tax=Erwinia citreus TaxID=558 RepID=UPI000E8A9F64|nr:YdbH family protein [Erwinia sp.]HBV39437.1 YdbH family protein [Erwinia sp.]
MTRGWKLFIIAIAAAAVLAGTVLITLSWWLPRLAGFWLPAATTVRLDGNPRWRSGAVWIPGIRYRTGDCELARASGVTLGRRQGRWLLGASRLEVNSVCFSQLSESRDQPTAPRSLAEWQSMLPKADVILSRVSVLPWQNWAGSLRLSLDPHQQRLSWQGENLSLRALLTGQQMDVQSLTLDVPGMTGPVSVTGLLTLPTIPDHLPDSGELAATLETASVPQPLRASLNWQQNSGTLTLRTPDEQEPLLMLPWQVSAQQIAVSQGHWRWPWAAQPVSGGIAMTFNHWQHGLSEMEMTGRLNVLTQGRGGKGNVVLSVGPGRLDWTQSQLPFRLTGESKLAQLLFFASIPGTLQGPLLDPVLHLHPGALLRMRGRLLSTLKVDEARWPLSGVTVSSAGIDGRLQAILTAHDAQLGRFRLHLDGRATAFWPDKGRWLWGYWGDGFMAPLAAKWDVKGRGNWQDRQIELNSLSTGFDRIRYGGVTMIAPRLTLAEPVRWRRDETDPAFSGRFRLNAQHTRFASGGYLPPAALLLGIKGSDPTHFLYKGSLTADPVGPVRVQGRWDGERLRGQAWWPQQSLKVFQSLLSDELKMTIRDGTLKAQVAFSAAADQGFTAGGHWVVSDGSVRTPDNEFTGVDFSLPFRLQTGQWYFGAKGPVSLRIKKIDNQFALQNIRADLQGWYPWSEARPLRLSNVGVDVLGGGLSLLSLQLPQTEAATLRLNHISMSELVTAIQPKKIAMSGHVNGALPLWLDNGAWLVKKGWITNSGPLTLRLDKEFADALAAGNIAAGAATDWLRYMEISRSQATLDIDNKGNMHLAAQVNGTSRFSNKNQHVSLHYTQQENIFQLWRSLRFGDNLQSWTEQHAALPAQGKTE